MYIIDEHLKMKFMDCIPFLVQYNLKNFDTRLKK